MSILRSSSKSKTGNRFSKFDDYGLRFICQHLLQPKFSDKLSDLLSRELRDERMCRFHTDSIFLNDISKAIALFDPSNPGTIPDIIKLSSFYYILTEFNNMDMQLRQALAVFGWADEEIFNIISDPVLGTYSLVLSTKEKFDEDGISSDLFKLAENAYANLSNRFASSHYLQKSILIKQLALIQINYDPPGAIKTLQLSNDINIWDDVIQASLADCKFKLAIC